MSINVPLTLITIAYDEQPGMSSETLINPATRRLYAIVRVSTGDGKPGDGLYFPVCADLTQSAPRQALQPIAVPGRPGQVYACDSSDQARMVLEAHDALLRESGGAV